MRAKRIHGAVAQLGERLVRNEEVGGSSPLSSTNENPWSQGFFCLCVSRAVFLCLAGRRGPRLRTDEIHHFFDCLNPPQEGIMNVSDPDEKKGMEAGFVEGLPVAHEGEPKQSIPGGRWFERRKSFERETERLEMGGRPGRPSAQLGGKIEVYTAPVEIGEGRRNADQHAGVGG